MKRVFLPVLFLALLLSVAFARELDEKQHVNDGNHQVDQFGGGPGWGGQPGGGGGPGWGGRPGGGGGPGWGGRPGGGGGPGWGGRPGGGGGPGWGGRPGWGGGPGWGGRPGGGGGPGWGGRPGWGCLYRCYYGRCCSAEEFAEFVQAQGIPQN